MRFTSKKEREFSLAGGPGCTGSSLLLLYSTRWPKSCVCVPLAAVGELLYSKVPPPSLPLLTYRSCILFSKARFRFGWWSGLGRRSTIGSLLAGKMCKNPSLALVTYWSFPGALLYLVMHDSLSLYLRTKVLPYLVEAWVGRVPS